MRSPEELRALAEEALDGLELWPQLHGPGRVGALLARGRRQARPAGDLPATGEAAGAEPEAALPAALALELIHTFSLVHDDLPALDDDEERRGHPSTWKQYGEAVGILAGDALHAEAFRLVAGYETTHVARELAEATLGMIGGQWLDITGTDDEVTLHKLKTGCLFAAAVGLALWAAGRARGRPGPWRAFGDELGLLFQIVDDILDGDGYVERHGIDGARRLADEAADRARARLAEVDADTSVLRAIVDDLAVRRCGLSSSRRGLPAAAASFAGQQRTRRPHERGHDSAHGERAVHRPGAGADRRRRRQRVRRERRGSRSRSAGAAARRRSRSATGRTRRTASPLRSAWPRRAAEARAGTCPVLRDRAMSQGASRRTGAARLVLLRGDFLRAPLVGRASPRLRGRDMSRTAAGMTRFGHG